MIRELQGMDRGRWVKLSVVAGTIVLFVGATYLLTGRGLLVAMLGGVAFIFLTAASYHNPERMLLALLFVSILVPMDLALKSGSLPRIGPTRVLMAAFYCGALLRLFINKSLHEQEAPHFPLAVPMLPYTISAFISAGLSISPLTSVYAVIGRELLEQFILFYLFISFMRAPGFWDRLRTVLYWATLFVCLFSYVELILRNNPLLGFYEGAWIDYRVGIPRCRSTFFHPIAMACYLNLVFPFILVDLLRPGTGLQRLSRLGLLVAVAVSSLLSVSRAPWICLGIEVLIFLIWYNWRHITRMVLIAALTGFLAMVFIVAYNTNATVNKLFHPLLNPTTLDEGSSEYYRWVVIKAIWEKLDHNRIFFGFGPNAFHLSKVKAQYQSHEKVLTAPDQHYARLAFEYGLVGAALFLVLLCGAILVCLRAVRRTPAPDGAWAVAALMGVVGFILVNLTVSMFPMYPLGMLFWLCVAVAASTPFPPAGSDAAGTPALDEAAA